MSHARHMSSRREAEVDNSVKNVTVVKVAFSADIATTRSGRRAVSYLVWTICRLTSVIHSSCKL
jgi:hypothetical protein